MLTKAQTQLNIFSSSPLQPVPLNPGYILDFCAPHGYYIEDRKSFRPPVLLFSLLSSIRSFLRREKADFLPLPDLEEPLHSDLALWRRFVEKKNGYGV